MQERGLSGSVASLLVSLGVLLVVNPGAGAIGITWAIGWLAFLFGSLELWLAWSSVARPTRWPHRHTRRPGKPGHAVS